MWTSGYDGISRSCKRTVVKLVVLVTSERWRLKQAKNEEGKIMFKNICFGTLATLLLAVVLVVSPAYAYENDAYNESQRMSLVEWASQSEPQVIRARWVGAPTLTVSRVIIATGMGNGAPGSNASLSWSLSESTRTRVDAWLAWSNIMPAPDRGREVPESRNHQTASGNHNVTSNAVAVQAFHIEVRGSYTIQ